MNDFSLDCLELKAFTANPLVSIIIPSYNQGRFIKQAIESAIRQDYRPIEITVIDGASTDDTVAILRNYEKVPELNWISEPDGGVVEAVNKGFAKASGDIFAIQSSDDWYMEGTIAKAVKIFREKKNVGLVYGETIKTNEKGEAIFHSKTNDFSLENFLSKKTWIPQPSAFFRRELVETFGGWSNDFYNADTEMWLRFVFRTKVEKIDEPVSYRRMHPNQRDNRHERIVESYWRMIDTSPDIAKLPKALKRAALCGKYLHASRYNGGNPLSSYYWRWRALCVYPSICEMLKFPRDFVPGLREAFYCLLSKCTPRA